MNPGVHIQEVTGGAPPIQAAPTSVCAFVGRAARGPVDDPVSLSSFGDYERLFGGLHAGCPTSYAVRDFFANGGTQALVVRVINGGSTATLDLPTTRRGVALRLAAADEGAWGNDLRVTVIHPARSRLFHLHVEEQGGLVEQHLDLSISPSHPGYVAEALARESRLVRVREGGAPNIRPRAASIPIPAQGGSDGASLTERQLTGNLEKGTGLYALGRAEGFNLLCIPPPARDADTPAGTYQAALAFCVRHRAMLLVDPPRAWAAASAEAGPATLGLTGPDARNAALFFPHLLAADPLQGGQIERFVPCGAVAGIIARTDASRGVWKAPAGAEASIKGIIGLSVSLTSAQTDPLARQGVNALRAIRGQGISVWGARTLRGGDAHADEFKYIPVRRLALFLEESLVRGLAWVVFEPNDGPLWGNVTRTTEAFLQDLFRQGAFQGRPPSEAFFVKCDAQTTTPSDVEGGRLNLLVGFAPVRPSEFVTLRVSLAAATP